MFRRAIALLSVVSLTGCAAMSHSAPTTAESAYADRAAVARPTSEELAAYAGHSKFPAEATPKNDLEVASIISSDKNTIKIYNFSGDSLRNVDVWVNGAFVQHVSGISPQSSVLIHVDELYNGLGKSFSSQSEPVSRVQIATDHGLYTTWGPASD